MFKKKNSVYKSMLKQKINDEISSNSVFYKGRKRTLILMSIYLGTHFLDAIISPILTNTQVMIGLDMILNFIVAIMGFSFALEGNIKIAGAFALLTAATSGFMMFLATKINWDSFVQMLQFSLLARFLLMLIITNGVIAIWMFTDKSIISFGKRRKELEEELGYELYMQSKQTTPSDDESGLEGEYSEEKSEVHGLDEKEENKRIIVEEIMEEFSDNEPTVRSTHNPIRIISRINKKGYETVRTIICKKYDCYEIIIDSSTSAVIFPAGGKILLKFDPEENRLDMESNTKLYDKEFHKLALEVIAYASKGIGIKFTITDLSNYADTKDEELLNDYFKRHSSN